MFLAYLVLSSIAPYKNNRLCNLGGVVRLLTKARHLVQLEELEEASALLKAETAAVHQQVGHDEVVDDEMVDAWSNAVSEWIYLPSQKRYGRIASATNSDKVESLQVRSLV